MTAKAVGEEIDLQIEAPALHIEIEILEVGIVDDGFVESPPAEAPGDYVGHGSFADSNVAGDSDEIQAFTH